MIKGDGFGKSLKQLFSILLISCFILLGNSFVNSDWVVRDNGNYGYSTIDNSIDLNVVNKGQLMSERFGRTKRMLALASSDTSKIYFFRSTNQLPYIFVNTEGIFYQGYLSHYYVCPLEFTGITNLNYSEHCTEHTINDNFATEVSSFFDSITINDFWGYFYRYRSNNCFSQYTIINNYCFSSISTNSSICFKGGNAGSSDPVCQGLKDEYTNSLGISSGTDFTSVSDGLLNTPPGFVFGNGDNGTDYGESIQYESISLDSDESAINYYESRYGWDSSICYVGTDSLDYLYGSNGVSFQQGQGLSIFEVFNQLYGNIDLDKVYVWLNSRLINYEQRFDRDTPLYLSTYNSGTNQVDLYYDNLTFPFSNNPVAFFFMSDYIVNNSPYSSMGSSVVSYCNLKINSGSYEQILDQADKSNINDYTSQYNINYGFNSDGTVRQFTGAWLSSGVEIAFSGNTTVKNTLRNFFDKFNDGLVLIGDGVGSGVLPSWLISAFLVFALFKLLRKK